MSLSAENLHQFNPGGTPRRNQRCCACHHNNQQQNASVRRRIERRDSIKHGVDQAGCKQAENNASYAPNACYAKTLQHESGYDLVP